MMQKVMLSTTTRHKSNILLDFLAPSLLNIVPRKAFSLSTARPKSAHSVNFKGYSDSYKAINVPSFRGLEATQIDLIKKVQAQLLSGHEKNDTGSILEALRLLDERQLLHALSPPQVEESLQVLLRELSAGKLGFYDEELYARIALQVANSTTTSTDPLCAFMLLRLRQGDFAAVIRLYDEYLKGLGGEKIWKSGDEEDEFISERAGLVSDAYDKGARVTPGRMTLLLTAIAAHASQDAFESALQTSLRAGIRFYPPSVDSFLVANFAHDPAFMEKFKCFIARLDIARMVSNPTSLSKHVMNLANNDSTELLESLYKSLADGLFGQDAYIAPEPTKKTAKKVVALTEVAWATFLSAFLRRRRRDLASKLWSDLLALDVTPRVLLWTTLIDSYGAINEADDAVASWNMMKAEGVQPDALTYRALIAALFKGRQRTEALRYFQLFQKLNLHGAPKAHLLSVYNTVIDGLLSFNDETAVQALLEEMEKQGPKPDLVSYNTLLAYYGRRGDFKGLARIVGRMAESKVAGDVYSFSTILSALLRAGRDDAPDVMINIMRKQGIQPNVATYSTIIDHQMQTPTPKTFETVMRLLHRMEEDAAAQPNVKTYTSILAGLDRIEGLDSRRKNEWRKEIVSHMKKRRIILNEATYNILISSSLKLPSPEGLKQALSYYREMRRRKLTTDTTWYVLFLGLLRRKSWAVAEEMISDMFNSGHQPSVAVRHLVDKFQQLKNDSIQAN
ncbi:hypothetical protein C0993_001147 [Termitomyces sp. T159_Od127]|nr:hypothetical protein C0993_001147 [Termitomyces sp. T159_Od127]